jgi:hypothetical protein
MSTKLYANATSQVFDRVKEAHGFLGDAMKAMLEEHPGEAQTYLEQAEMTISGAATLAKWATTLVKEKQG